MSTPIVMSIFNPHHIANHSPHKLYSCLVPASLPQQSRIDRLSSSSRSLSSSDTKHSAPQPDDPSLPHHHSIMRTSKSTRTSKPPAPALIVEPSVPAACASLLSLRTGGLAAASPAVGNLPMLTTALSLLENTSRTVLPSPKDPSRRPISSVTSPASHNSIPPHSSNAQRPPTSADVQIKHSQSKTPNTSRFWNTVLPTMPRYGKLPTAMPAHSPISSSASNAQYHPKTTTSQAGPAKARATVRSPENSNTKSSQRSGGRASGSAALSPDGSAEDESNKMNIPCVVCGVRFRKPGHLSMHWRGVHATSADAVYPGHIHAGPSAAPTSPTPSSRPSRESSSAARISKAKGARPYGCPQCHSRFRRGSDRNRHMRMVHAKIRPFKCTQCGSHFGRKSFLEAHISTVHEKQRPYRCECGAAFGQRSSLTRHSKKIHGTS